MWSSKNSHVVADRVRPGKQRNPLRSRTQSSRTKWDHGCTTAGRRAILPGRCALCGDWPIAPQARGRQRVSSPAPLASQPPLNYGARAGTALHRHHQWRRRNRRNSVRVCAGDPLAFPGFPSAGPAPDRVWQGGSWMTKNPSASSSFLLIYDLGFFCLLLVLSVVDEIDRDKQTTGSSSSSFPFPFPVPARPLYRRLEHRSGIVDAAGSRHLEEYIISRRRPPLPRTPPLKL